MCINESILVKELKRQLRDSDFKEVKYKNKIAYLQREIRELKRERNVFAELCRGEV